MNLLCLVFSLLLIFSYTLFVSFEKQSGQRELKTAYLGYERASRKLLNLSQREIYESFPKEKSILSETKKEAAESPKKESPPPPINPECAKINLWPLLQEGREAQPLLYEKTLRLFSLFYRKELFDKAEAPAHFLDQFLALLTPVFDKEGFSLSKLSFKDKKEQILYYKMLKGTSEWSLANQVGYPSLLDYIKISADREKLCLCHAHPDLIAVLFSPKAAPLIFAKIQEEKTLGKAALEDLCARAHLVAIPPSFFDWVQIGKPTHRKNKKQTVIVKDEKSAVSLRKELKIPSFDEG